MAHETETEPVPEQSPPVGPIAALTPTPIGVPNGAEVDELASFYRYLAGAEFDGYCDLYARVARAMADDRELLARVVALAPAAKVLPVLLNAAVHHLVLAEPASALAAIYRGAPGDPWPLFRSILIDRFDEVADLVTTRTIQTNEVGRSAVLLPVLSAVHRLTGKPLALVEVGPSAGLNLLLDRFGYRYDRVGAEAVVRGDPSSPVQVSCEVRGDLLPPVDLEVPPIAHRVGIDLSPVDVRDPSACRWLEACVWPLVPDRAERLRAAIGLARGDVPTVQRGNALDLLADTIDAVADDLVPCVLSTWVLAYFSPEGRVDIGRILDEIGTTRDVALITGEYPGIAPFIERPDREPTGQDGEGASLLGLTTWLAGTRHSRPVAWTHAHGRWMAWLDAETARAPDDHPPSGGPHGPS